MYSPPAVNVPMLSNKGDSRLGVYYAAGISGTNQSSVDLEGSYNRGFDVQAAWAFSKHWAVMLNQSNRYERNIGDYRNVIDSAIIQYRRSITEFGLGYYLPFSNGRMCFQVFSGGGFGRFRLRDDGEETGIGLYSRYHRSSVLRFFIQPSIQANIGKNSCVSFTSRFSSILFNSIETDYTLAEQDRYLISNLGSDARVFWEPAFTTHIGFKRIPGFRTEFQIAFAALVSRRFIDYRNLSFNMGVSVDLKKLFGGR